MSDAMNNALNKALSRTKRVSLCIEADLAKRMREAARNEAIPRSLANFIENLLLWALPHYYKAASLRLLQQAEVSVPKVKLPRRSRRNKRVTGAS